MAAVVALLVGVGAESKSLGARATCIDKVDVVHLEVRSPGSQSGGEIVTSGVILTFALCDGNSVGSKAARVSSLSVYSETGLESRNVHLFLVGAWYISSEHISKFSPFYLPL